MKRGSTAELPAPRDPWFHPFAPYVIPFALALAARVDAWRSLPYAAEDAYITFRYAENAAKGLGFVYNAGERVMGYTSPAWTAWLAAGAALGVDTFAWARAWGLVLSLVAFGLVVRTLDREDGVGRVPAWAFGLFFAVFPLFSAHAVLGMETSLFLAALAAAVAARDPARGVAAQALHGALLALLALTRPEGFVIALGLAVFASMRARLVFAALAGAALAALAAYYGSPVPQSFLAKATTYGVGARPFAFEWIEGFVPAFLVQRWQTLLEAQHLFPLAVVGLPAALAGLWTLGRRRAWSPTLAFSVAGLAVLAAYVAFGVPYFGWYFVLPVAAWAVAAATGLPSVTRSRLVWAALGVYVLSDAPYLANLYVGRNAAEAGLFVPAADRLAAHSGGRGTVFLEPIGHIGYRTGLRVIDEVGLVSPDVPRRRKAGAGWYGDVIRERRPEYLVVRPALIDQNQALAGIAAPFRSFAERDEILADYDLVGEPPRAADELVVLVRRLPAGTPATAP